MLKTSLIDVEAPKIKVNLEPTLSLKQFIYYLNGSPVARASILKKAKYPAFVPRPYEEARHLICSTLDTNYRDITIYESEFTKRALDYRKQSVSLEKSAKTGKTCSANALVGISEMIKQLEPIIERYIIRDNLNETKQYLKIEGVRIGTMADLMLFEEDGETLAGFIKFNFTPKKIDKTAGEYILYLIRRYFIESKSMKFETQNCLLINVPEKKIYKANSSEKRIKATIEAVCKEINDRWDKITND